MPPHKAPVAQLDRVPGYEPGGRTFESCRARHFFTFRASNLLAFFVSRTLIFSSLFRIQLFPVLFCTFVGISGQAVVYSNAFSW